ncbi:hypothetical protein HanXRQr2_Chr17g0779781 [Helianthus annuus]|uniref:Uncharacterized protein n=1 Tax=Helianthus annuus TaxID=4232 RepID=A0A9K3DDG2_HELAN|nr:hypothetical protein HanXRQr2_Chr17g0779781 [Helianthus annuus]KAJ0811203.1 hypothetical protein HanPSC8_Chr17g0748161 [Helianthus annuus]
MSSNKQHAHSLLCVCVSVILCIYIYIERERESRKYLQRESRVPKGRCSSSAAATRATNLQKIPKSKDIGEDEDFVFLLKA